MINREGGGVERRAEIRKEGDGETQGNIRQGGERERGLIRQGGKRERRAEIRE